MKFIFADSLDYVDPAYDFIADRSPSARKPYWDDAYPHEILGYAPYDGILVSRGIIGGHGISGKYTQAQAMRFRRVGARAFLRLDQPKFSHLDLFGDCGAFTYVKHTVPPYTPADTALFYDECGFTHGCSVDHIIFDFDDSLIGLTGGSEEARRRSDITLANAREFIRESRQSGRFTPMGVVQGWSPSSMADAARQLVSMGYDYLALGGMVPLKAEQIRSCLSAIRSVIPNHVRLHILGFAKANELGSFNKFDIASFDTTSPLIRAFKDAKQNYFLRTAPEKLQYFMAIRVPQAISNPKLQQLVKSGSFNAEDLLSLEIDALRVLRAYDKRECDISEVIEPVLRYNAVVATELPYEQVSHTPTMQTLANAYRETLQNRPWERCNCTICKSVGIEVMIFRASNRNKRRGFHNLSVFKNIVDDISVGQEIA